MNEPEHDLPSYSDFPNEITASFRFVYTFSERIPGKRHWVRIGVAFINKDSSVNIRLDALPTNGQLFIKR